LLSHDRLYYFLNSITIQIKQIGSFGKVEFVLKFGLKVTEPCVYISQSCDSLVSKFEDVCISAVITTI